MKLNNTVWGILILAMLTVIDISVSPTYADSTATDVKSMTASEKLDAILDKIEKYETDAVMTSVMVAELKAQLEVSEAYRHKLEEANDALNRELSKLYEENDLLRQYVNDWRKWAEDDERRIKLFKNALGPKDFAKLCKEHPEVCIPKNKGGKDNHVN